MMRNLVTISASALALAVAAPAAAQDASVDSYLCTFAGKCGTQIAQADTDAPVTKAAPATKGFRLAAPQSAQPTTAAPATKGFRLAAPQQAPAASTTAPATKSFRLARSTPATQPAAQPVARVAPRRAALTSATRPAMAAGQRANLMLAFEYNSDQMTAAAQAKARTFAQALMTPELKDKRFLIEGHTDSRGARDLNVDLSRRRAQSVADFLVSQGVDRSRVEVKGVGPDEPLPGRSPAAEANRRVEAVLLS
jgi:outer membrane protein OmpA-like peptidoglycan-associated protein